MSKCKNTYADQEKYREYTKRYKRRYYARTANSERSSKRWTDEDDSLVLSHEMSDTELSARIGRSVMSIQTRRNRLKKEYGDEIMDMRNVAKFEKVSLEEFEDKCRSVLDITDHDDVMEIHKPIRLPQRATFGSAGYDFYSPVDFVLGPDETALIPTGIRCSMKGNVVLMLFPRSGMGFKYRLQLDNTVGVIDSDYYHSDNEGHIMIKVTNDSKTGKVLYVRQGEAFAQGVFLQYGTVIGDNATAIRNGGFGSTDN